MTCLICVIFSDLWLIFLDLFFPSWRVCVLAFMCEASLGARM